MDFGAWIEVVIACLVIVAALLYFAAFVFLGPLGVLGLGLLNGYLVWRLD